MWRDPRASAGLAPAAGCASGAIWRRDLAALKQRRMAAADMFAKGKRQIDVVTKLGVSAQTASRWHKAFLAEGKKGLAGAGRAGRLPKLSDDQLALVEAALVAGPRTNGFPTEMWTLARVAEVIETVTGVRYSQTQTWTILRERLHWSRQRPARRAVERDDEAIATWVEKDWPRTKKAPGAAAPGSSSKTRAAAQHDWLVVERLPGYAHDINPIEMVWGNVKTVELANLCPDTIDQAHAAAETGLNRVGSSYDLCYAFLAHTGLSL